MADFDRNDDRLPERFHKELLKAGPPKNITMPAEAMAMALSEYYYLRGWDSDGKPTLDKLEDLEVESIFVEQYKKYIIDRSLLK